MQFSWLASSFPHAQNEECDYEGKHSEAIEDSDNDIMLGEEVHGPMVAHKADFIVFLVKDDGLVVEKEVS